jgi:hypothetical protein
MSLSDRSAADDQNSLHTDSSTTPTDSPALNARKRAQHEDESLHGDLQIGCDEPSCERNRRCRGQFPRQISLPQFYASFRRIHPPAPDCRPAGVPNFSRGIFDDGVELRSSATSVGHRPTVNHLQFGHHIEAATDVCIDPVLRAHRGTVILAVNRRHLCVTGDGQRAPV